MYLGRQSRRISHPSFKERIDESSLAKGVQLKSVCVVVSSPLILKFFLADHVAALGRIYRVVCATKCADASWLRERGIEAPVFDIPIERRPSPLHDFRSLFELYRTFKRNRFDVVHSVTPKGGLLAMTAAALARVPVRIHTFTGQVWANRSGLRRRFLKAMDAWLAAMATHTLVDSESQRAFLLREGVVSARKSSVLSHGSISGVDIERFRPDATLRAEMRSRQDLAPSAVVFLYLGRLKREKGVLDLAAAFAEVALDHDNACLVIVGPDEDKIETRIRRFCGQCISRVRFHGYTDNPEKWLAAGDVLCLPSYREGFGSSIIEAAAAGLPAIGSRIYGIVDAIEEGKTGLLHQPGDRDELADKMKLLLEDNELRRSLGAAARERARRYYSKETVTAALLGFYEQTLAAGGGM